MRAAQLQRALEAAEEERSRPPVQPFDWFGFARSIARPVTVRAVETQEKERGE